MMRLPLLLTSMALLVSSNSAADPGLDSALGGVAADLPKWATVCVVQPSAGGKGSVYEWHDFKDTGQRQDFWPASTIKLYAVLAALELLDQHGMPLDTVVSFERQNEASQWRLDCARTAREMIGEVFRRSSNEDYTLLLRMVGLDRINTEFLVPARGFRSSALMRGYVKERPWAYVREEPQRITLTAVPAGKTIALEHRWSGRFYAEERGCTVIDAKTGNVTSPRELVDCLRRVFFHEHLPDKERFRMSAEALHFVRLGDKDTSWNGLAETGTDSGPYSWPDDLRQAFPGARFHHKCGLISDHALDLAWVETGPGSGFVWLLAVKAGHATKPDPGDVWVGRMTSALVPWLKQKLPPVSQPQR